MRGFPLPYNSLFCETDLVFRAPEIVPFAWARLFDDDQAMVAKGFATLPAIVVVAWVSPMVIFHGNIAVALFMATNLINGGEALLG